MDPVVHFEIPLEESKRITKFYSKAFGWKMKPLGKKKDDYILATTSMLNKDGTPQQAGIINGGFYPKNKDWPAQYPSIVIAVDDIGESMKKVEKAGGKVLGEPMKIPGFGLYVSFYDTEGNRVSMMEPSMD